MNCCPCVNCSPTAAEFLLEVGRHLMEPRHRLIVVQDEMSDTELAVIRLARDFYQQPKGFQFQAIVEAWSQQKIVQEMY